MIIRKRPNGLRLFFLYRGSVLQVIKLKLAITLLVAILVTLSHGMFFHLKITLTPIPFSIMAIALAIFLGFRNSASYDRYWEGRKLWGQLTIVSRDLARQTLSFISAREDQNSTQPPLAPADPRLRILRRLIALVHSVRHHLRDSDPTADAHEFLDPDERIEFEQAQNKPDFLLRRMALDLRSCLDEQRICEYFVARMDESLAGLASVIGGCERIKNTPIPYSYTLLLHRTSYLYCYLLPFGLVDSIGYMTPFVVGIVSYTFFGLDALGEELEEPFITAPNSLPLTALCRSIERDLREAMGESDLPEPLQPVDFCLL
ncbi:MAG: bestrophin [Desulfuromonadales bacterium]|nr:bestrophin [Desulfuromonadales bacterium]